ncbi:MAG: hypothetical protein WBC97_09165 [Gemmatimonadales bacterium]
MFKRSHIGTVLVLSAALGLAACGSKDTGPSFAGTISNSSAADAGASADGFAGDLASTFNFGTGPNISLSAKASPKAVALLNRAWMAAGGRAPRYTIKGIAKAPLDMSSTSGCSALTGSSGDTTDTDGDGIPNNDVITISCDTTLADGTHESVHGSASIADVTGLYGYHFDVNLTEVLSRPDTSLTVVISGHDYALFTAPSASDDLDLTISEVDKIGSVSAGGAIHENWDATFTAFGGSIVLGDPLPDGTIAFTGGFYITNVADGTQNFNFNILTVTPLSFVASCYAADDQPPFDSGEIKGEFNGSASVGFTVTYSACSSAPDVVGTGNAS